MLKMACLAVSESNLAISNIDSDFCCVYSFKTGNFTDLIELLGEMYNNWAVNQLNLQKSCAAFSSDGKLFAFNTNKAKFLSVWNTEDWSLIENKKLIKHATSIVFTPKTKVVIVGDKRGDVYSFEKGPVRVLGHSSMVLDICFSRDEKYIVTCDSDEKVRVSHYPNGRIILHYLMGHAEYVSGICLLDKFLLSGSGDCTLRLWDIGSGDYLNDLMLDRPIQNVVEVNFQYCIAAVQFYDSCELYFVKLEKNKDGYSIVLAQQETFESSVLNLSVCDNKLWINTRDTFYSFTVANGYIVQEENCVAQQKLKRYFKKFYVPIKNTDLKAYLHQKMVDRRKRIQECCT